jgi:hypothetical protein
MALRLTTPASFPFCLLYGTPVAFAGDCEEKDGTLKSSNLQGPVLIEPVAKVSVIDDEGDEQYEESLM